jgi:2'-5' RNA ligase
VRRRLFIAAPLDDERRAACGAVAERLRAKGFVARYVPPENYHLTVAFLGGVDEERIPAISESLRALAPTLPPVVIPLEHVGAFPGPRRPRIVWIGPERGVPAFGALCGVVRSALVALGFSFDPHTDPHVTLARSDGHTQLPAVRAPSVAPLRIDALTLYESRTLPDGARYEALERFAAR